MHAIKTSNRQECCVSNMCVDNQRQIGPKTTALAYKCSIEVAITATNIQLFNQRSPVWILRPFQKCDLMSYQYSRTWNSQSSVAYASRKCCKKPQRLCYPILQVEIAVTYAGLCSVVLHPSLEIHRLSRHSSLILCLSRPLYLRLVNPTNPCEISPVPSSSPPLLHGPAVFVVSVKTTLL